MPSGFLGALLLTVSGAVMPAQEPVIPAQEPADTTSPARDGWIPVSASAFNEYRDSEGIESPPGETTVGGDGLPSDSTATTDPPHTLLAPLDPFPVQGVWPAPSDRFRLSAEYLLWWIRSGATPPLVVTGPATDPFPGALDQPGTRVLFGRNGISHDELNGTRLNLGYWLDDAGRWGFEASGFVMEHKVARFAARGDANGQPFLAAPFVNALTGNDNVYFISQNFADPLISGFMTGGVRGSNSLRLDGWELNGVCNQRRDDGWTLDYLAGFRHLSMSEDFQYRTAASNLALGGAASFLGASLDPGFVVATFDRFQTENEFYGGQIGGRFDRRWGWVRLDVTGKLALGATHQEVDIHGRTRTDAPLAVQQAAGGVYAQQSNIGSTSRDVFTVVPELGISLMMDLSSNVRVGIGYNFLYMSSVVRPGDQIDAKLNPNQVPIDPGYGAPGGPDRPSFDMKSTDFWAQGLNLSVEFWF